MKQLIVAIGILGSLTAQAGECPHKVLKDAVVITPIYQARVDYQFDDENKTGTAYVSWGVNEQGSRDCFNKVQARYPDLKASVGRIRVSSLEAKVFKAEASGKISLSDMAGGFYMGNTDLMAVPYSAKGEIKKAVASKLDLISISGDAYFEYSVQEKTVVGELPCVANAEVTGVVNLHKRLGEVIKLINARPAEEKVSRDEVLDQFMTSCVSFSDLDVGSMVEFETASLRKTKLMKGSLKLMGLGKVYKKEKAEAMNLQESTFLEF